MWLNAKVERPTAPLKRSRFVGFLILSEAIEGRPRSEVLRARTSDFGHPLAEVLAGSWREKRRDKIESSAYVIYSLESALWCVARTGSFEEAVFAANLGNHADTISALTGRLAGALCGLSQIPERWLKKIAWRTQIQQMSERLFSQGQTLNDQT